MTDSRFEEMYRHLAFECRSFEHKREYVQNRPVLYSAASLATLDSIIETSENHSKPLLRLLRNLLSEIEKRGVDEAFRNYGYVDKEHIRLFLQFANDANVGITLANLKAQNNLCDLDNSIKIKIINWYAAFYPSCDAMRLFALKQLLVYLKGIIG